MRSKLLLKVLVASAGLAAANLRAQVTIPADFALPASAADTSKPGFLWDVSEVLAGEPNQLSWAQDQLSGLKGQNFADPNALGEDASGPATAGATANAPIRFVIPKSINFSIADGDTTHASTNIIAVTQEDQMPGLPGTGGNNGTDNIAAEALAYLSLPAGTNTMGVRSDDGFRVTIGGATPSDIFSTQATVAGEFNGGRGAADTIFSFVIQKAGLYAVRLLYENGGGDANVQWFTVRPDGKYVLVNDTANGGIPAYRAVTTPTPAYASGIFPAPGSTGASPQPTLKVILNDGATPIDASKIMLTFNGAVVTPTTTRAGTQTTVTYTPPSLLSANASQTAVLTYMDGTTPRTNAWSFTTGNYITLPASMAVQPDSAKPGFKFNIFANSKNAGGADAEPGNESFNNDFRDIAEQALNMVYNDWSDQTVVPLPLAANLANPAAKGSAIAPAAALPAMNAPAEFEIAGTINFTPTSTPGLPATDGSTEAANGELLTFVSLPAGLTAFGVTSPDLYRVYFGSWDYTKGLLAAHLNGYGAPDTEFYVIASAAGVYPMRFVWNHAQNADPALSIYTIGPDGAHHLLNDTAKGGLAAYRALAAPSEPYIKFTSPGPFMRQLIYPSYSMVVNIADGGVGVDDSSPALTLDGKAIAVAKTRVGDVLMLKYAPTTLQVPTEVHTATLAFKDKNGKSFSETWSFMNLKAIWLPATPVASENFDEYPGDGTVFNAPANAWSTNWSNPLQPNPKSWYVFGYSHRETDASGAFIPEDLTNPNSDSYMSFVVVPIDTFKSIEGDVDTIFPLETLNGQPVTALGANNIFIAESDNRTGNIMPGQVQFAYSKAYDLSSVANPVVSIAVLAKVNQDNIYSIEYSVDGGTNWAPIAYYLDGGAYNNDPPDIFLNPDGTVDAVTTLTHREGEQPIWTDWYGHVRGGNYGDGIAAPITQALGPFFEGRSDDGKYDGKRIEVVRLPLAAHKKDVRLRFGSLGSCSWYFGVDNIAFYDVAPSGATAPTGIATATTPAFSGFAVSADRKSAVLTYTGALQSATAVIGPWTDVAGAVSPYTAAINSTGNLFYRVH